MELFSIRIRRTFQLVSTNKVFLIGNKQYLCEKIEAEIDADGLNKVLKGTFYRIE